MVLGSPVVCTLLYYINIFLGLALCNSFGIREGYLVGISIGTLVGLMIGNGEVSLVGLSLGLTLGSPLDSPNPGAELPGTLMGVPLGFWFGSEALRCLCCFCLIMYFQEATCWG